MRYSVTVVLPVDYKCGTTGTFSKLNRRGMLNVHVCFFMFRLKKWAGEDISKPIFLEDFEYI